MLDELSGYENLGTPAYFAELFGFLNGSETDCKTHDIAARFFNRVIDDRQIFDGCLPLLKHAGAVHVNDSGTVVISSELLPALLSDNYLKNKLLEMILIAAKKDDRFFDLFSSNHLSFDIIYRRIQIETAAFSFRYANFRNLLISFSFLDPHPDQNIRKYLINPKFKKLFDRELLSEIKRRKVGVDELYNQIEANRIAGTDAEIFVEEYERRRLSDHTSKDRIQRISDYDTKAGYDVVSFENNDSTEIDRFIEVKSYSSKVGFFWSRNEMDVARIKGSSYYLYLIDRDSMQSGDYAPSIIQNPFENILADGNWTKRVENYYITSTGQAVENSHA
jgi:hypothetical protein